MVKLLKPALTGVFNGNVPAGGGPIVHNIDISQIFAVRMLENTPGPLIPSVGTVDPTNVSTLDANLINDNTTDLCYNNSVTGSANKELPGIDLGASLAVADIELWWWNNTYTCSDFNIQESSDGVNFTDVPGATGLDSSGVVGTPANPMIIPVNVTNRYFRVFSVVGNNPTFVVVSEMRARDVAPPAMYRMVHDEIFVKALSPGQIEVTSNFAAAVDYQIGYLQ